MSETKRVCVYCGSKTGNNPKFREEAKNLGHALAASKIGLVYGGGSVGLMDEIANATLDRGGKCMALSHSICMIWRWPMSSLRPCISPIPCTSAKP